MTQFKPTEISKEHEDDLRAEARTAMFFALRSAFKARAEEYNLKAKDLAEALGKDKGYVSRVLNGTSGSIDFETLFVFLEALGYHLPLDPISYEELKGRKVNFDARPTGVKFSLDTNQAVSTSSAKMLSKTDWHVDYDAISGTNEQSIQLSGGVKFKFLEDAR
ncbi:helix-turn-helix domain-containing protein [Methylobacterium nodulans]|uniref:Helix-turn-helix domain protein n=1 Tax=Methylobacterium nodulans (strain LMG 21967 / CNCM I-2342 / ORS 2060) TaxID=460265 RepID=B8IMJ3_METNO|nr:helix-turn-helix transcriptional regulator [Methylobacterium nodulans]ACL58379.1 helix-turn-helix domain protein [Methylobacterium nodulans ORS 2060]